MTPGFISLFQRAMRGIRRAPKPSQTSSNAPSTNTLVRPPHGGTLFLDFDGVLHPGNSGTFNLLPSLEALLLRFPEIEIVVSSTWRSAGLGSVQQIFSDEVARQVIGITPFLDGYAARGREVMAVVNAYLIKNWIVLDDDARLFSSGFPNLMLTDSRLGITNAHIQALEALFLHWRGDEIDDEYFGRNQEALRRLLAE